MLIAKLSGGSTAMALSGGRQLAEESRQTTTAALVGAWQSLSHSVLQAQQNLVSQWHEENLAWTGPPAPLPPDRGPAITALQGLSSRLDVISDAIIAALRSGDPNFTLLDALEGRANLDQTALLAQVAQLRAVDADFQRLGFGTTLPPELTAAKPTSIADAIKFVGYAALGLGALFVAYKIVSAISESQKNKAIDRALPA